jgi:DNA-binding SARP family transcriptional activator/TolB-like protein/Tfp pilus assembly protein PilF
VGFEKKQYILAKPTAAVRASLFGSFQLTAPDGGEVVISNRRARALFAMLCLAPDEPIDRDHLSKLLWPGRFEAQARASLRQCLLDLSKLLTAADCDLLDISRSRISLKLEAVITDLAALEAALVNQQYLEAAGQLLSIGAKPLLDQMHFGDDFGNWLDSRRRQTELRLQSAVSKALLTLKQNDNVADYEQLLNSWSVRNPSADAINEADGRASDTFNDEPASDEPASYSVGVIPLENAGAKDENLLADDVSRDLVAMLSRAPHLSVAAFDAGLRSKLEQSSPAEVGRSLNVHYIVSGSLARRADRLVLRVGLVNVSTNAHILSWRFDEDIDQFYARLDDFMLDLSTPILSEIQIDETSTAHLRGEGKINGFEGVQSIEMLRALYSESRASKIVEHLRELIKREPANAVARGSLAVQLVQNVVNRWTQTPAATQAEACRLVERALAMAPNDPDVLMAAGIVPAMLVNPQSAIHYLTRSLEINPNNPHALAVLGWQKCMLYRDEAGLNMIRAAERRAPHHPRFSVWAAYRAICEVKLGRLDKAAAAHREASERNPNYYSPHLHGAAWLALLKRDQEARTAIDKCLAILPHLTLQDYTVEIEKWEHMLPDWLTQEECISAMRRVWPEAENSASSH